MRMDAVVEAPIKQLVLGRVLKAFKYLHDELSARQIHKYIHSPISLKLEA
jgi:hypothetical protein